MNRTLRALAALGLFAVAAGSARAGPAPRSREPAPHFVVGVVPQFEQTKLFSVWAPILMELERRTGFHFEMATALSITEFEAQLAEGRYDFVYANPFHILNQLGKQGYEPIVKDAAPLRGVLVVRRDSPFQKPTDLEGKVVAMPSPNALGAALLMRADLERIHHTKVQPMYVKNHTSVYLHVAKGLADAGGGVEKTLSEQAPAVRDLLRVIYTTRPMPSHPLAVHPRVPAEVREAVRRALLELGTSAEGQALLAKIPMKKATSTSLGEYQPILDWQLQSYWDASWRD